MAERLFGPHTQITTLQGEEKMLEKRQEEIINKAIEFYGETNQQIKATEEMAELQVEIMKHLQEEENELELAGELADVIIMVNQLMNIYGNEELVKRYIEHKIERLQGRMSSAEK